MYELYCGNKNYSSWSLRAWLMLRRFDIPFTEHMVSVSGKGVSEQHRAYSDNGLVPCLHDGETRVWESIAIAEYLAERHPGMWPADGAARAHARSVSAEMHAGFVALRGAMPMNIKMRLPAAERETDVQADIDRITHIWQQARARFGVPRGPYLYGNFSIADAMYAPVVWRFATFSVDLPDSAAAYRDTMLADPAMQQWQREALAEKVTLAAYDAQLEARGGALRS